jgi:opacity protein-like surface antigen
MNKRAFAILVLLAFMATGAFAQGISMAAGGGLLFDWSDNNGVDIKSGGVSGYTGLQNLSYGGFGFIDVAYAELDVSFAYGQLTWVNDYPGNKGTENFGTALQLGLTLLGKYPIGLGGFTLFPLVGADYNMVLSGKDKDGHSYDDAGDLSQFGLLAGAGLDFPFSDAFFLRAEALFHLRFPSKVIKDAADANKTSGVSVDTTLGIGPRIKIGLGYRF